MVDNVIDFKTRDGVVGDGVVIDPDTILEANKGLFTKLVLVGQDENGVMHVASSHSESEAFLMLHVGADMMVHNYRPDT